MESQSLEYVSCLKNQKHLSLVQLKVTRRTEFMLETNWVSQADKSSNINSMLRRIMEQKLSVAGSSS